MDSRWRIEMFGGLRASQPGRALTRFRTNKAAILLGYLACYPSHRHPRETLIELLWPESTPEAGRNNLSTALSFLRHPLEPPGTPAGAVVSADRLSVQLNPVAITTDLAEFEAALRYAAECRNDLERILTLESAVTLYTGDLLAGYYDNWILTERGRLAAMCLQALRELSAHHERSGNLEQAIESALRGARLDPLEEAIHCDLIRLYIANGQATAALKAYRNLEQHLAQELGAVPAETTRAVLSAIATAREQPDSKEQRKRDRKPLSRQPLTAISPVQQPHSDAPRGTVTLLIIALTYATAAVGEDHETHTAAAIRLYDLLRQEFGSRGGYEVKASDTEFIVAFRRTRDAVTCAIASQKRLALGDESNPLSQMYARMAIHTGDIDHQAGDGQGPALPHVSLLLAATHLGQILCTEETAGLLRHGLADEVYLNDLGVFRLMDMSMPVRLYQVSYAGMPRSDFPPPPAAWAYEATLPLQFTRFIGRRREISQLRNVLMPQPKPMQSHGSARPRLITLTGPGGVGKTRFALEVAGQLMEPLSGAVFFVSLAEVTDATSVPNALVGGLKLAYAPGNTPMQQVVERLSQQPSLLLLDNCEQLVPLEALHQVLQTLLEGVPFLTILATSRRRVDWPGEYEIPLLPLQTPPLEQKRKSPSDMGIAPHLLGSDLADLFTIESIALFVDRAQTARADFQLTSRNAKVVAELCARLEGIPLAIELAAARSQVLTPSQMLTQLNRRFNFLIGRARDGMERHRTLHSAIAWSYRLLAPELQRFFAQLAIFRGGWTLAAAEAVCAEPLALDYLAQLQDCSLVNTQEAQNEMRFSMLETLREFALEQLSLAQRQELQRRHYHYFLTWVQGCQVELLGLNQVLWLSRLQSDYDNLRAALDPLIAASSLGQVTVVRNTDLSSDSASQSPVVASQDADFPQEDEGLALAAALQRYWMLRGPAQEGLKYLAVFLSHNSGRGRSKARADALLGAGTLAGVAGDYPTAHAYFEASLPLQRELGNLRSEAICLGNLGILADLQEDVDAARAHYEAALVVNREIGDPYVEANTLSNLGIIAKKVQSYEKALICFEASLAIRRTLGDKQGIAVSLVNLGPLLFEQGDEAAAQACLTECLHLCLEVGDRRVTAYALQAFAEMDRAQVRQERAVTLYGAIDSLRKQSNLPLSPRERAAFEETLADLQTQIGRQAFTNVLQAGQAMSIEEAITYALPPLEK